MMLTPHLLVVLKFKVHGAIYCHSLIHFNGVVLN